MCGGLGLWRREVGAVSRTLFVWSDPLACPASVDHPFAIRALSWLVARRQPCGHDLGGDLRPACGSRSSSAGVGCCRTTRLGGRWRPWPPAVLSRKPGRSRFQGWRRTLPLGRYPDTSPIVRGFAARRSARFRAGRRRRYIRCPCRNVESHSRPDIRCGSRRAARITSVALCRAAVAQPTISRVHRSISTAGYTQPSRVGTRMISPTIRRPGASAVKSRRSRSGAGGAAPCGRVSERRLRPVAPRMPRSRMIPATRSRWTTRTRRRSAAVMK